MNVPETRYAKTADGVHIAYQVRGNGPVDLVYVAGFASNFEVDLEDRRIRAFFEHLATFSRVILFDKRGTGLSDRRQTPDLDMRADDLRAVLDAARSDRAVLFGESEGGALSAFFAAAHPDRVLALVLYGSGARYAWAPDYPTGITPEAHARWRDDIAKGWGSIDFARRWVEDEAPSLANDEDYVRWFAKNLRHSASPAAALEFDEIWYALDVRGILGTVQAPTLVLQRAGVFDEGVNPPSRYLAERIPGARYEELPGRDHVIIAGDAKRVVEITERFVRSIRAEESEFERALATVLFTDIVGSTERAASAGDASWKTLLERHHEVVRALLGRYRGREVDTAGDGFFATFDAPARAVRCARAAAAAVRDLGIEIRGGVHTGEVETIDGKVGGLAVIIGARVGTKAGPSQIFVSQTVKDLVAGSRLVFEDAGEHELKGVPDRWHLYRVIE